jgi:hypothetical protein
MHTRDTRVLPTKVSKHNLRREAPRQWGAGGGGWGGEERVLEGGMRVEKMKLKEGLGGEGLGEVRRNSQARLVLSGVLGGQGTQRERERQRDREGGGLGRGAYAGARASGARKAVLKMGGGVRGGGGG